MIGDIRVDLTDWEGPLDDLEGQLAEVVDSSLLESMTEAADRVRHSDKYEHHTHAYENSVEGVLEGSFSSGQLVGVVRATAPHAAFLEHGTKAHTIEPKATSGPVQQRVKSRKSRAQMGSHRSLAFEAGGGMVFRKKVEHPGTDALHLVEESITEQEVDARMQDAVHRHLGDT